MCGKRLLFQNVADDVGPSLLRIQNLLPGLHFCSGNTVSSFAHPRKNIV